jgi:hypothetical protein
MERSVDRMKVTEDKAEWRAFVVTAMDLRSYIRGREVD